MKTAKKSQANTFTYLVVAFIIILIACLKQPTLRSTLGIGNNRMWQELVDQINSDNQNVVQELWKFRDFYSRGTIYLQKNQELVIPDELSSALTFPNSFKPYLVYEAPKIRSVEGSISATDAVFFSKELLDTLGWELLTQTSNVQVIKAKNTNVALVIAVFDLETASTANGYLYFDMREKKFRESVIDKKWLVVSLVTL